MLPRAFLFFIVVVKLITCWRVHGLTGVDCMVVWLLVHIFVKKVMHCQGWGRVINILWDIWITFSHWEWVILYHRYKYFYLYDSFRLYEYGIFISHLNSHWLIEHRMQIDWRIWNLSSKCNSTSNHRQCILIKISNQLFTFLAHINSSHAPLIILTLVELIRTHNFPTNHVGTTVNQGNG